MFYVDHSCFHTLNTILIAGGGGFGAHLRCMCFEERLRHNQRENESSIAGHLDGLGFDMNLSPRDGFVRTGAGVAAIKFLPSVDIDGVLGTVAHEISVACVMLDYATPKNDPTSNGGMRDT